MAKTLKILTDSWCVSTISFSKHLKGAYLELLIAQNEQETLSLDDIKNILGVDFDLYWESKLKIKFNVDKEGRYYNDTDIRIKEKDKILSSEQAILNEQELVEKKRKFKATIEPYVDIYGAEKCNAFYKYWTEPNRSKTKLKWELQETWELGMRLKKFKLFNQLNKKKVYQGSVMPQPLTAEDIEFRKTYEELKNKGKGITGGKSLAEKMQDKFGTNE